MKGVIAYVTENYDALPKSFFNEDEVVIVLEVRNDDHGYGNHSYEGVGIDRTGKVFWCFSSGCSCDGSCGMQHENDLKKFQVGEGDFDMDSVDPKEINYAGLQVDFQDYG